MYGGVDNLFETNTSEKRVMSGLEKDNLINAIKGLQIEQQELVIQTFPDDVLWNELKRRYDEVILLGHKMRELIK